MDLIDITDYSNNIFLTLDIIDVFCVKKTSGI